jgi:hypothetical protein
MFFLVKNNSYFSLDTSIINIRSNLGSFPLCAHLNVWIMLLSVLSYCIVFFSAKITLIPINIYKSSIRSFWNNSAFKTTITKMIIEWMAGSHNFLTQSSVDNAIFEPILSHTQNKIYFALISNLAFNWLKERSFWIIRQMESHIKIAIIWWAS